MIETEESKTKTLDIPTQNNSVSDDSEIDDADDDDISIPFDYDITSFGADFPVDALVRRMNSGDIIVPTFGEYVSIDSGIVGFQRNLVWSKPKSDRFIESLLIGLPVPGIFLVRDQDQKLLVLDGQQRLRTLQKFYDSSNTEKRYRLTKVLPQFVGKRYDQLDPSDRRRLDDSIIHATIVRQDQPTDDQTSIYNIFERLNTGGVNLNPQEIRAALYHGEFAQLLIELNQDSHWRSLYGIESKRLKDLEMILRFFAFYFNGENYARPLKKFLNDFMGKNRNLESHSKHELEKIFTQTVSFIDRHLGKDAFRPDGVLNAAAMDSIMTGIAKRIQKGSINNVAEIKIQIQRLFSNERFISSIKTGTSHEDKVHTRQHLASEAFSKIQ